MAWRSSRAGRIDEALAAYDKAIALKPDHAAAHNNRGLALLRLGRAAEALASFDRATAIAPNHPDAFVNRGLVLIELGRFEAALASLDRAAAIAPSHVEALSHRGRALIELKRPEAALASLDRALAIDPATFVTLNLRGGALAELGRFDAALASFDRALAIRPDYAEALENKASLLAQHGHMAEAKAAIESAVDHAPKRARAYFLLTTSSASSATIRVSRRWRISPPTSASLSVGEQVDLNFALAKVYRDLGDPERSFPRLAAGAALKRKMVAYDEARALDGFKRAETTFTRERMHGDAGGGDPRRHRVFIVGMPRSGTTLIEQILAGHPKVFGAGELAISPGVGRCAPATRSRPLSRIAPRFRRSSCASSAPITCGASGPCARGRADHRQDPGNFAVLGSFAGAAARKSSMPGAIRSTPASPASCRISTTAACPTPTISRARPHLRAYDALMAHWRAVLPAGAMLEVQYEEVVADIEGQARRIVAYCGLEWTRLPRIPERRPPGAHGQRGRSAPADLRHRDRPLAPYKQFLGPLRDAPGP